MSAPVTWKQLAPLVEFAELGRGPAWGGAHVYVHKPGPGGRWWVVKVFGLEWDASARCRARGVARAAGLRMARYVVRFGRTR